MLTLKLLSVSFFKFLICLTISMFSKVNDFMFVKPNNFADRGCFEEIAET